MPGLPKIILTDLRDETGWELPTKVVFQPTNTGEFSNAFPGGKSCFGWASDTCLVWLLLNHIPIPTDTKTDMAAMGSWLETGNPTLQRPNIP